MDGHGHRQKTTLSEQTRIAELPENPFSGNDCQCVPGGWGEQYCRYHQWRPKVMLDKQAECMLALLERNEQKDCNCVGSRSGSGCGYHWY